MIHISHAFIVFGVRTVFLILSQLDILCTSAVKRYYLKWQFTVHIWPVSCQLEFTKARQTCRRVVQTSIWSIPYSGELCNKNCIVKTSETLIVWSASCYTAGSDKSDAREVAPDQLLKRMAMVFRVHSRHAELLLTYWCSQSAMIINFEGTVCNNWTSYLLLLKSWTLWYIERLPIRELCTFKNGPLFRPTM